MDPSLFPVIVALIDDIEKSAEKDIDLFDEDSDLLEMMSDPGEED